MGQDAGFTRRGRIGLVGFLACAAVLQVGQPSHAESVTVATVVRTLAIPATLREGTDVSGVALSGEHLILAVDEGRKIQVLERVAGDSYDIVETQALLPGNEDGELDLEGLAWTGTHVYAIGSHSRKRKAVKADPVNGKKAKKNLKRLYETATEPSRENLFRFRVEDDGKIKKEHIEHLSLRDLFADHPILRRFQAIPGKENGIDVEGIAAGAEDEVYLGFRGPVLRGGYVPIVIVDLERDDGGLKVAGDDIRFVHLGGRGVRDLARLPGSDAAPRFLILAGPMGDGPGSYQLYEWDGKHAVPGRDKPHAHEHAVVQCEIPPPEGEPGAKAEGIALLEARPDTLEFLVVYDSAAQGAATVLSCPRRATGGDG